MREEIIGDATLYLGDCREILPRMYEVDAVVTDPPYGIGEAAGKNKSRGQLAVSRDYGNLDWDNAPAAPETIDFIRFLSKWQIIFGGNYFELPPSSCWLVWDKQNGDTDFADCELAWTNMRKAVRRIYWRWHGMIRRGDDVREHPTQKPVGVMSWCIEQLPDDVVTILDPFMGSGSTGVAAIKSGKKFVGIEREPKYFEVACRRISEARNQPDLLIAPPEAKPIQQSLLTGDKP